MTADENISPPQARPFNFIPCLATVGALLLYALTLNHWVSRLSLPLIASVTGWDWHPFPLAWRAAPVHPLYLILTWPVRIFPAGWQPLLLNAFAALCASLALGLLAASVRLLPHDRTRDQRQRESGEFSLLSGPLAFIPPVFAFLVLALQLAFWRNAINASSDMLDVLVFAALIHCLLRFRISQNDNLLVGFAFLYGLGTTNDWALIGFFPLFLTAMIWMKGVTFLNFRFIGRLVLWGLAGLSLYLIVPTIESLGRDRANFLTILHMEIGAQTFSLRMVPRWVVVVAALPSILPLFFAGIRWPSFEGELSAAGHALTRYMFRALHVVFLLLALIMFFDYKYSPSLRLQEESTQFLTFYYLAALAVGYYSGYVLLIFGKGSMQSWERRGGLVKGINLTIAGAACALAVAAPCALVAQNGPHISASKNSALADYFREMVRELPARPVILLSDEPTKTYLLQAELNREGKANKNILIDSAALPHREYIAYLESRYPDLKKLTTAADKLPPMMPAMKLVEYLAGLTRNFSIYYLHPSFGYYFEAFYLRPHGLIYEMQLFQKDVMVPPVLSPAEIKTNADFWARIQKQTPSTIQHLAELDPDVNATCVDYSLSMNWLGVEMQKAGLLAEANALFAASIKLNPLNFLAKINKLYNEHLQKGDRRPIDTGDFLYKALMRYHSLMPIMKYNGSVDEPDMDLQFGQIMAEGKDYRQAAIFFDRRLQLLPNDPAAQLDMTKTFVDWGLQDKALEWVKKLRANPAIKRWDISRVEALAYYNKNDYPTAERLMLNALAEDPKDINRVSVLAEFYRVTAEAAMRQNKEAEGMRRFTNALTYINEELQFLLDAHNAPDSHDVLDVMLKKAEVQMLLKAYDASIATLTQIVELQPKNPTALLNRATAEVQIKKFADAKDDFKKLRRLLPEQTYLCDMGMADIADRQKDKDTEIHYLKRFLDTAPGNSPEYIQIKQRLKKLQSSP